MPRADVLGVHVGRTEAQIVRARRRVRRTRPVVAAAAAIVERTIVVVATIGELERLRRNLASGSITIGIH